MTTREAFTAAAITGIVLSEGKYSHDAIAVEAVKIADAAIKRLNETNPALEKDVD